MRSKNNKRKPASRRQGKFALLLKRIARISFIAVSVTAILLGSYFLAQAFYVREIELSGNRHLDKGDVEALLNIRREPILNLSLKEISEKLRANAWIKNAYVRWQLPGTLIVEIEETTPKALLSYGGAMYLVNEDGDVMEKLEGQGTPFLPLIKEIDPRYKKVMAEAMDLVAALTEKNIIADRQVVEIGLDSYGLNMNIDGEFIKVGYGQYGEKFDRWMELEPELKKRGMPLQYVDLRFRDSVIIKPVEQEKNNEKGKVQGDAKDKARGIVEKEKAKLKKMEKEKRIS